MSASTNNINTDGMSSARRSSIGSVASNSSGDSSNSHTQGTCLSQIRKKQEQQQQQQLQQKQQQRQQHDASMTKEGMSIGADDHDGRFTPPIHPQHLLSSSIASTATARKISGGTSTAPTSLLEKRRSTSRAATTSSSHNKSQSKYTQKPPPSPQKQEQEQPKHLPTLDPFVGKLERYELFCTSQSYYLVGCNKLNTVYRLLKMDRTLIERPPSEEDKKQQTGGGTTTTTGATNAASPPSAVLSAKSPILPAASANNRTNPPSSPSRRIDLPASITNNSNPTPIEDSTNNSILATTDNNSLTGGDNPSNNNNSAVAAATASTPIIPSTTSMVPPAADASHTAKPNLRPLSDFLSEDPNVYTQEEIQDMLDMIHDGNRIISREGEQGSHNDPSSPGGGGGGLKPICKAYGIVGFVRFLDCYHLTLITRRSKVGSIGGNGIYTVKNTETFPIKPAERSLGTGTDVDNIHADPSSVLLSMWNRGKRSVGLGLTNREIAELRYQGLYEVVDMTKNFFFSYTYDVTRSLQENFLINTSQTFPPPPCKDMFAWNYFLTREFESCTNPLTSFQWIMPIIHGAFVQRKLNDYGRSLNVSLLARRSRHFAGTRYLKRGVSEEGKVANDVEHEQIVHDESKSASNGIFSSYLQVRGSIPTFWTQESSVTMPKPPIELNRVDPTYTATQTHFEDLLKRYGSPVVVLDLVKQSEKREREVRVGNEYRHAIDYINSSIDDMHKIRYCALDYSHVSKHRHLDWKIMQGGSIEPFTEVDIQASSIFPEKFGVPVFPMEQTGVLRTNCIDCLDRTNVAQFSAGVEAMAQQLVVMGIRSNPKLDPTSNITRVLIDLYVDIGDHIALQYGGSEAHKKVNTERSESTAGPIGKHKELLTSIRRYYSNAFTDNLKQDAMNLFLGYYVPYRHAIPLWEMETDYYLHNFHVRTGRGTFRSMKAYQLAFGVLDWEDDDNTDSAAGEKELTLSNSSLRGSLVSRRAGSSQTLGSVDKALVDDHSRRIERVRTRCATQNQALSAWWKIALQTNVRQRMWNQRGHLPSESLLPPRYDRVYQPEKMAQFDRFFARSWATPVRRTHAAQHSFSSDGETETLGFRRIISDTRREKVVDILAPDAEMTEQEMADRQGGQSLSIQHYVERHGFVPRVSPMLRTFVGHHDSRLVSKGDRQTQHSYIGSTSNFNEEPKKEYLEYVSPQDDACPFRSKSYEEFQSALHDMSLGSNDVNGISKLAESAHVGKIIRSGPYKGLDCNTSATEVATVIQEQHNAYENMRNRGELRDGIPLMDSELQRRGFYKESVKNDVTNGWRRHTSSERQYAETVSDISPHYIRSDLTTASSLHLYASFFPPEKPLSVTDVTFLVGSSASEKGTSTRSKKAPSSDAVGFVARASRVGIPMRAHEDLLNSRSEPLFMLDRRGPVPVGFEMINEDMFARKDNKFMVFNGAGVDSWKESVPLTKTAGIESMLLGALGTE